MSPFAHLDPRLYYERYYLTHIPVEENRKLHTTFSLQHQMKQHRSYSGETT